MNLKIKYILAFMIFLPSIVYCGQFGLSMGMTIDNIDKKAKQISANSYEVKVPSPHSMFKAYIVDVSPTLGLYQITAISKDIDTSSDGASLKINFLDMEQKLVKRYGKNKKIDYLMQGSLWNSPKYWMMGLIKNERKYFSRWDYIKNTTDNLQSVILIAAAKEQNSGWLGLTYRYLTYEACIKEKMTKEDDSL